MRDSDILLALVDDILDGRRPDIRAALGVVGDAFEEAGDRAQADCYHALAHPLTIIGVSTTRTGGTLTACHLTAVNAAAQARLTLDADSGLNGERRRTFLTGLSTSLGA